MNRLNKHLKRAMVPPKGHYTFHKNMNYNELYLEKTHLKHIELIFIIMTITQNAHHDEAAEIYLPSALALVF